VDEGAKILPSMVVGAWERRGQTEGSKVLLRIFFIGKKRKTRPADLRNTHKTQKMTPPKIVSDNKV